MKKLKRLDRSNPFLNSNNNNSTNNPFMVSLMDTSNPFAGIKSIQKYYKNFSAFGISRKNTDFVFSYSKILK